MLCAGFFFGRTPLIKLSPKKTWEGFFGGLILTVVSSWYLAEFMSRYKWMICPRTVRLLIKSHQLWHTCLGSFQTLAVQC